MEGATSVPMGLAYPVRDVEGSWIHMIRGRGMTCGKHSFMMCLSSLTVVTNQEFKPFSPGPRGSLD